MGGGGDPRSPVDIDSHIALGCDERLTGVNSDAHTDRAFGKAILSFARRLDSVAGPRERIEQRVSLSVHLDPAALSERGTEDPSMFRENLRVLVTEVVQERRRALDVGEEEGDGSEREIAHSPG